ncbi:MAG: GNAT family N-acetyltransferase [Rhodospirillales bacterium]|nr:GNAT family N-acetyltransferase [Rhodospirillales bacterium]
MTTTTTPVTLRDATEADVPHIRRLTRGLAEYEKLLHEAVATEDAFRSAMFGAQPRAFAILAEPAGQPPVGIALWYYTFSTFTGRPDIFLEDLFVQPEYRGQRIGLGLLRALAQRAVAENCRRVEWRVLNWNQPSIDFYASIGATPMQDWHVRQLGGAALRALAEGDRHG